MVQERFWEKIDHRNECFSNDSSKCWEWLGAKDKDGYGFIRHNGKNVRAHRFMQRFLGVGMPLGVGVPGHTKVLHHCDNPSCVKPRHLFLGSNSDNQRDAARKGRHASTKITPDDVRYIRKACSLGFSQSDVAREFRLHPSSVCKIMSGARWSHVD